MKYALFFAAIFVANLSAQTIEMRPGSPRFEWNSSGYFKDRPREAFFNWKGYAYTFDGLQYTTWAAMFLSGYAHGMREAYHADPYVFERRWGVDKESFWGSDAWKRNYWGNDPDRGHKPEIFGNVGRDAWHTLGFSSKAVFVSGSFVIGARKRHPIKYRAANMLIGWAMHSIGANISYNKFRQ